jgi:hypothetical protein
MPPVSPSAPKKDKKDKKAKAGKRVEKVLKLPASLITGCFKEHLRLGMLTPREAVFAKSLIDYFDAQGRLTEKQIITGTKTLIRVIKECEVPQECFP